MKSLAVYAVPAVWDEIARQVRYIARDSIDNALAWEARVVSAIYSLEDFHGHAIDHEASNQFGYSIRKLVFEKTYLIHYNVDEEAGLIKVLNFRHGMRLPQDGKL